MRFRAKIAHEKFKVLFDIVSYLSRIGHSCVCILSLDEMQLAQKGSGEEIQAFANINPSQLFTECIIVQSKSDNNIIMPFDLPMLSKALSSGQDARVVVLKLSKRKGISCLTLETKIVVIKIVHDIPVVIQSTTKIKDYSRPQVPLPEVHIDIPLIRHLRSDIDKMNSMSPVIAVEATMVGTMVLRVETDVVK